MELGAILGNFVGDLIPLAFGLVELADGVHIVLDQVAGGEEFPLWRPLGWIARDLSIQLSLKQALA